MKELPVFCFLFFWIFFFSFARKAKIYNAFLYFYWFIQIQEINSSNHQTHLAEYLTAFFFPFISMKVRKQRERVIKSKEMNDNQQQIKYKEKLDL